MLVVARKVNQGVRVHGPCEVILVETAKKGIAKLGIRADLDVDIDRMDAQPRKQETRTHLSVEWDEVGQQHFLKGRLVITGNAEDLIRIQRELDEYLKIQIEQL